MYTFFVNKWRNIIFLVLAFYCVGLSCSQRSSAGNDGSELIPWPGSGQQKNGNGEERFTIGFSIATATFIIERWNKDLRVFTGAARELGADVIVQLSAGGVLEQISQINYMVNQNIDILVVIAHDTELIAGAIRQTREAGIPVIAYDRLIQGVPLDGYISFDSTEVGRHLGQALLGEVPRGRYLIVNGSIHDINSFDINTGLHEILDPFVQRGDIEIGREIWLNEWSSDEALEKIREVFAETTEFDAIACANDAIAGAAIHLLSERRMAGHIVVVGQDAELSACQRVVEGTQLMTVYKPIGTLGVRAATVAVALARRARGDTEQDIPPPDVMVDNQSGAAVPAYLEGTTAIFRHNIDIIIHDGFHSRDDIFRNVAH